MGSGTGKLVQFDKYDIVAEDAMGACCLDGLCKSKTLNIEDEKD